MKKHIRITDIFFFGLIFVVMVVILISFISGWKLPEYFTLCWITCLTPIIIVKVFFPRNKITKWLEKRRW